MAKPRKSVLKRIKITKRGALIRRVAGQNHFQAKESRKRQRRQRARRTLDGSAARKLRRYGA